MLNEIISIGWVLLGVCLLGFYNGVLLLDDKTLEEDPKNVSIESKWHIIGAIIFLYLVGTTWYFCGNEYVLFSLSSFWVLYAGIVHKIGLNKPFFYVGTTAKTDKLIRRFFPKNPEVKSGILKLMFLIVSIILIFCL